jgi:O-antigen ligase
MVNLAAGDAAKGLGWMMKDEQRLRAALVLFAMAPPVLAAATFAYEQSTSVLVQFFRWFSTPVTLIEWLCVGLAMSVGISPLAEMARLPRWSQITLAILIMIAAGTAGTATADPVAAIVRTAAWFFHLLFGVTLTGLIARCRSQKILTLIWPLIITGLLIFAAGLVLFVAFIPAPKSFLWIDFFYGVINVRQLGFYSGSGFAIAVSLAMVRSEARSRIIFAVAASLLIAVSFWSGTRSSLLAIACGIGFTFISIPAVRRWRNAGLAAFSILAGLALAFIHVPPHPELGVWRLFDDSQTANFDVASGGRWTMWRQALEVAVERPIFGFGESQYRLTVPGAQGTFNHPHNSIVQMIFQWGAAGAACFFALFGFAWLAVWQVARVNPELGVPGFMTISTMFAMSMIEGSLYHTWPVAMMAFCVAVALGGARALRGDGIAARL